MVSILHGFDQSAGLLAVEHPQPEVCAFGAVIVENGGIWASSECGPA
jgi:hypothetical protein